MGYLSYGLSTLLWGDSAFITSEGQINILRLRLLLQFDGRGPFHSAFKLQLMPKK
jgi:hypothetical protein